MEITSPIKDDDNEMNVNCKSLDHSWPAHAEPVPNGGLDGYENCKQLLGLEDPANRLPKAVERTAPMARILSSLVVVWFHQTGHQSLHFPFRPWYPKKEEPSFADLLTTLRRVSYDEKTERLLPKPSPLKTWIAQLTELLSRAG